MAEQRIIQQLNIEQLKQYLSERGVGYEIHDSKVELEDVKVVIPHCHIIRPVWFWKDGSQVSRKLIYNS